MDELTQAIFENARCEQDKLAAYTSLMMSLDSRGDHERAVQLCCNIIGKQGIKLPRKPTLLHVVIKFLRTRKMLRGKTFDTILNLNPMTDTNALITMSLIHVLYPIVVIQRKLLVPICAFYLVQLTLRYGISALNKWNVARLCASLSVPTCNALTLLTFTFVRWCRVCVLRHCARPPWQD